LPPLPEELPASPPRAVIVIVSFFVFIYDNIVGYPAFSISPPSPIFKEEKNAIFSASSAEKYL
jgi:hypothetical protein